MNIFSYKIEHDLGLAPNPFGPYCSLAVCRGSVRGNQRLSLGDWVIGTGSKSLERLTGRPLIHHLIFAMKVEETLTFNQYWEDQRFQYKKPVVNGSLVKMYGDNFYHTDPVSGEWVQENSAHSKESGEKHEEHTRKDTRVDKVLLSQNFYYFGDNAIQIPEEYWLVCSEGRDMKGPAIPEELKEPFIVWLTHGNSTGIHGDPINWIKHTL